MKPLIVANWKCNPITLREANRLFNSVVKGIKNTCPEPSRKVEVVICPPFVYLPLLVSQDLSFAVSFGGQSCFWEENGAFTGEISPAMLKDLGCEYVIIGHSERRKYQKETDEMINKKLKAALKAGLKVILCIDNISQIKKDLNHLTTQSLNHLILAYEPLFAIGTGKPCSTEKANKMRILIKEVLNKKIPILYGGSVNSQNAGNYIEKGGFQGLLIGGVSLDSKEFVKIVKSTNKD